MAHLHGELKGFDWRTVSMHANAENPGPRFLGFFWNENGQNGNEQNYWIMKQEKKNACS